MEEEICGPEQVRGKKSIFTTKKDFLTQKYTCSDKIVSDMVDEVESSIG